MTAVTWLKATCPVCGREYQFIEGQYKPPTCTAYDCLYKWLHDPCYRSLQSQFDQQRKKAGV